MKMQERKTGETKQKIVKYMNWRPFGVSDKEHGEQKNQKGFIYSGVKREKRLLKRIKC